MRNLKLIFASVVLALLAFVSCSKDEEVATFDQSLLYGVWEMTGGDGFVACPSGDNKLIEISETTIKEGQTNDNGCDNGGYVALEYDYINGNTLDAGIGTYKVKSLKNDVMTMEIGSILAPGTVIKWTLQKK